MIGTIASSPKGNLSPKATVKSSSELNKKNRPIEHLVNNDGCEANSNQISKILNNGHNLNGFVSTASKGVNVCLNNDGNGVEALGVVIQYLVFHVSMLYFNYNIPTYII